MGLILDLLLLPITGPVRGLKLVLGAVRDEAEATRLGASRARAELSELELRRDLGEISDEEYAEQESILLNRLNDSLAGDEHRSSSPRSADGDVVEGESEDGDSGFVEYVDGEYVDYVDEDYVDEEDDVDEEDGVDDPDEDDER